MRADWRAAVGAAHKTPGLPLTRARAGGGFSSTSRILPPRAHALVLALHCASSMASVSLERCARAQPARSGRANRYGTGRCGRRHDPDLMLILNGALAMDHRSRRILLTGMRDAHLRYDGFRCRSPFTHSRGGGDIYPPDAEWRCREVAQPAHSYVHGRSMRSPG